MTPQRALLEAMLQAVAERLGDPAVPVHERLFRHHPELRALFVGDTRGVVRGEMFMRALDAVLAQADGAAYAAGVVGTERINHAGLGVPGALFDSYFEVMTEVLREAAGPAWSTPVANAWAEAVHAVRAQP